ncbi:MAG TPA: 6-carboxytetrahydropterin synthase [Planctomycetes bacterium]|nr:6-carboxytetrahydropterin synthase [Planctomycetota bacterium]HIJ69851.1 6-carboxytetrahydropterin synthase [Planctomycetota bacterium]
MFTVTVQTSFTARHQLTMPGCEVEPLHEHKWVVRSAVSAEELDENGLVVDFHWLGAKINGVAQLLDGARLEELACFGGTSASAENVAKYIYDKLKPLLPERVKLQYVEVSEAAGCWARYTG